MPERRRFRRSRGFYCPFWKRGLDKKDCKECGAYRGDGKDKGKDFIVCAYE